MADEMNKMLLLCMLSLSYKVVEIACWLCSLKARYFRYIRTSQ